MNGEGIGSLSGIGNGWKDPYPTGTHKMLTEDLRCCGEYQALPGHETTLEPGRDPADVPLWAQSNVLLHRQRTRKTSARWLTPCHDEIRVEAIGRDFLHIDQAMATRIVRGNPGEAKRMQN